MIARIRTDQTLADFEGGVRNLVRDVEEAYWELYFAYRDLEARKMGRDSAQETWKRTAALVPHRLARRQRRPRSPGPIAILPVPRAGRAGADRSVPRRKRACGTSWACRCPTAGLIRPSDEPTTARVAFDWAGIHTRGADRGAWRSAGRSGKSSGANWN